MGVETEMDSGFISETFDSETVYCISDNTINSYQPHLHDPLSLVWGDMNDYMQNHMMVQL